jgi:hypothetical protein
VEGRIQNTGVRNAAYRPNRELRTPNPEPRCAGGAREKDVKLEWLVRIVAMLSRLVLPLYLDGLMREIPAPFAVHRFLTT